MGLFNGLKRKKGDGDNQPHAGQGGSPAPAPKRARQKYHSKRKKSNLIQDMKINGSVPTTIIDAIHGDKSIISSDQDSVRAQKVNLNGKIYYPVFIMDEDTFEKSGIDEPANRKTYGQLSNGLKTSSGATGLLPIVTDDSTRNNYFAILPMHDAFVFLDEKSVFADYQPGWLAGLLNIDNDTLQLQKTDIRLTMSQWMDFVNGKLNFKVDHGQLALDQNLPETSDPLAFSGAENGNDDSQAPQQSAGDPLAAFDEPDATDQSKDDTSQDNGYGIDDMPIDDGGNNESAPQQQPQQPQPAQNQPQPQSQNPAPQQPASQPNQNNNAVPQQQPQQQLQQQPAPQRPYQQPQAQYQPQPQSNPRPANTNVPNNNAINTTNSRDALAADNVTLSSTVRTLNDLKISISDQEFIDAYMKPLRINPIPMLDATHDPTGNIHHINELRKQANLELQSAENTVKARLRQWFETQRAGELDALNEGVSDDGSLIQAQRGILKKLQKNLTDEDGLRSLAQSDIQTQLDRLDHQFDEARENARQAALVEVDAQFNQRQVQVDQHKNELVQQQIAKSRQNIARQITGVKDKIQQIAQTAASQGYMKIMEQGATEYRNSQQALDHLHRKLLDQLSRYEKQTRDEENKRVADQAVIVKNDTTVNTLREQLKQADVNYRNEIAKQERQAQRSIDEFKAQAEQTKNTELQHMRERVEAAESTSKVSEQRLVTQQDNYEKLLKKREDDYSNKLKAIQEDIRTNDAKTDQAYKRFKMLMIGSVILAVLFGGLIGFFSGSSSAYRNTVDQRNTGYTTPVYQYTPQTTPSQSNSQSNQTTNQQSDSTTSSSHKTTSNAKHAESQSDSASQDTQDSSN